MQNYKNKKIPKITKTIYKCKLRAYGTQYEIKGRYVIIQGDVR